MVRRYSIGDLLDQGRQKATLQRAVRQAQLPLAQISALDLKAPDVALPRHHPHASIGSHDIGSDAFLFPKVMVCCQLSQRKERRVVDERLKLRDYLRNLFRLF
jgi:hypothetical protein